MSASDPKQTGRSLVFATNGTVSDQKCDILFIPDAVLGVGEAMRRREFITVLIGTAVSWPLDARAEPPNTPLVGFLNVESPDGFQPMATAFTQGLQETGYMEGQSVAIEYRWAEGQSDRLPAMVNDFIHRQVAVIAATSTPAALAAKMATRTIPIVFETGGDPIKLGLVASLNRSGGNVTGVTQLTAGLVPKGLEVLHELLPTAKTVALLVNPADPSLAEEETMEAMSAAQMLGLELHVLKASTEEQLEAIFANLSQSRTSGLVVGPESFFTSHTGQLAALAVRHAVPTIYKGREFAAAGGLVSYGTSITSSYRLAGVYTGRVLKGEKPADLPVQQATKIELYINLKTAKTLGITVPLPLSGRADEVIE
jgi:putative tryptophan/tyrosine transport system substrate-binding protein